MRHPVVFKHFGQETKTRLVNQKKKTKWMTGMTCGQYFRIVDTLKCVYSQLEFNQGLVLIARKRRHASLLHLVTEASLSIMSQKWAVWQLLVESSK